MKAALICFTARGELTMQAAAQALQKRGWETACYVKRKAADTGQKAAECCINRKVSDSEMKEAESKLCVKPQISELQDTEIAQTPDISRESVHLCEESLQQWCQNMFATHKLLVFVGAVGIAVRGIAPFVGDKRTDPAVIAIDEAATYVIPLLSGHIGGANENARWLAEDLSAIAVITTATDINQKFAVDVFAKKNNLQISDMKLAKEVSADILLGKKILISTDSEMEEQLADIKWPAELIFSRHLEVCQKFMKQNAQYPVSAKKVIDEEISNAKALDKKASDLESTGRKKKNHEKDSNEDRISDVRVHIGIRQQKHCGKQKLLYLVPKAAVLGIGCKKGMSREVISHQIEAVLAENQILKEAVDLVATIDLKAKEPGLLELIKQEKWGFQTFSADELKQVPGTYQASAFVQSVTGVDNVCERSARLASNYGKIIIEKHGACGVTVACAQKDWSVNL